MRAGSLRLRLLAGAALWVLLALFLTGAVILFLFRAHIERTSLLALEANLERLVAAIDPEAPLGALGQPLGDPRFATPFGGLYWQVEDAVSLEVARSRSLWDTSLVIPEHGHEGGDLVSTLSGPEGQHLYLLHRDVQYDTANGPRGYVLAVAEDRANLDQAIAQFSLELALALVVLALALMAAAWLQVHLGLRPLAALQRGIAAVRAGSAEQIVGAYPSEVVPSVRQINDLLAAQAKSVEFARSRAADLAHGLRTPLSAISATAQQLAEAGNADSASILDDAVTEMSDRIDYQLRLASLRVRTPSQMLSTSLNSAIARIVAVLMKSQEGRELDWKVALGNDVAVNIDRHDLIELIGVILDNAAKWAAARVEVATSFVDGKALVVVSDDGPGLTEAEIGALGTRGQRLDQSRQGSGFGLAIAGEILALNGGAMTMQRARGGGLEVRLALPASAEGHPTLS